MGKVISLEDYKSKKFDWQIKPIWQQEEELKLAYEELNNITPNPHEWDSYFEEMIKKSKSLT